MSCIYFSYNPFTERSMVLVNNNTASPYSQLNNFLNQSFGMFCMNLAGTGYNEINGNYSLCFSSGPFETFMMSELAGRVQGVAFERKAPANGITFSKRFEMLKKSGYAFPVSSRACFVCSGSINADEVAECLLGAGGDFDGTNGLEYSRYADFNPVSIIQADGARQDVNINIGFFTDKKQAVGFCESAPGFIPCVALIIDDGNTVEAVHNKYLISVSKGLLPDLIPDMLDSLVVTKTIACAVRDEGLVFQTEEERELVTALEPVVKFDCAPEIRYNTCYRPRVTVYPAGCRVTGIDIKSSAPEVIRVNGDSLIGETPGMAEVEFYVRGCKEPGLRMRVSVYRETRIDRIDLSSCSEYIEAGKGFTLSGIVYPQDAQNLAELTWESDNPSVAVVDRNGNVKAVAEGRCRITLSTADVCASCEVEVAPAVQSISVKTGNGIKVRNSVVRSMISKQIPVEVQILPENAYDTSFGAQISSEGTSYPCITYHDGVIETVGVGKSTITFTSNDSGVKASLTVDVVNTLNPPRNPCKGIAVVLLIASTIVAFYGSLIGISFALAAAVFGVFSLLAAKRIKNRLSSIVGYERKYPIVSNYVIIVLSILSFVFNLGYYFYYV